MHQDAVAPDIDEEILHAFDWSATPLGPVAHWSPELQAAVRAQLRGTTSPPARTFTSEFEAIYRNAPVGLCVFDAQLRWVNLNERLAEINGFTIDEHLGKTPREIVPSIGEHVESLLRQVLNTGETLCCEIAGTSQTEPQQMRYMLEHLVPLRDSDGCIIGVSVSLEDITERRQAELALRESEARFHILADATFEGIAIHADGILLDANEQLCRMHGYTFDEVIGRSIADFLAPEDLDRVRESIASGSEQKNYYVNIRKDGSRLPIEAQSRTAWIDGQQVRITAIRDVTARLQAESEREAMLALLQLLNSPKELPVLITALCDFFQNWSGCEAVGIRLRDGDDFPYFETRGFAHDFVQAEKTLCARLPDGTPERDANGSMVLECMCGNILQGRTDPTLPFFTEGGSFWTNSTTQLLAGTTETERQARTRNRCHTAGYESVALIPLRLGSVTYGLLQLNDTRTDRFTPERMALAEWLCQHFAIALAERQTRQQLERERAFLTAAIDTLPVPLSFIDTDHVMRRANVISDEWRREIGIDTWLETQLYKPRAYQPMAFEERPALRALRGEVVRGEEYRLTAPGYDFDIPCLMYAAPVRLDDEIVAAVTVIENITALKEADRAKDEFLAVLSHELQTPLTNMLGWSVEGLRSTDPAFLRRALEVVHRNAVRQRRLVDEILDMSRLIHHKIELQMERVDLCAQAELAVESALPHAARRQVALTLTECRAPLPVIADPLRLQQSIGNLLHNALKFTPAGGRVTVACRRENDHAVLAVTDTGIGIDPAALDTLFQVFHQVNRDERAGGLGLGLAVSRGIIELHGGDIVAHSAGPDLGSTFTIIIPLAPEPTGASVRSTDDIDHSVD